MVAAWPRAMFRPMHGAIWRRMAAMPTRRHAGMRPYSLCFLTKTSRKPSGLASTCTGVLPENAEGQDQAADPVTLFEGSRRSGNPLQSHEVTSVTERCVIYVSTQRDHHPVMSYCLLFGSVIKMRRN